MKTKVDLRKQIREKRLALKQEWLEEKSVKIHKALAAMPEFKKAKVVCCYVSMPGEVMTGMVIEKSWKGGKTVCVPVYRKESERYELVEFYANSSLVAGRFGVPEPAVAEWMDEQKVDFVVAPGMAFDEEGRRVGHGGGWYDRILGGMKQKVFRAGLAFEFQLFDEVPADGRDVRMDAIVTEKRVIRSAGRAH